MLPDGVRVVGKDAGFLRNEILLGGDLGRVSAEVDGTVTSGMISDGFHDNVAGLGGHQPNALLVQQIPYFLPRMIVFVVEVRRANGERGLKAGQEGLIRESIVGTVMGQYHHVGLGAEHFGASQSGRNARILHVTQT
jgi:hypothetical protein